MKRVRQAFGPKKENMLEKINEYTEKNIECEKRQDDGFGHATIYTIQSVSEESHDSKKKDSSVVPPSEWRSVGFLEMPL